MELMVLISAIRSEIGKLIKTPNDKPVYTVNNGFIDYGKDFQIGVYLTNAAKYTGLNGEKYNGNQTRIKLIVQGTQLGNDYMNTRAAADKIFNMLVTWQNAHKLAPGYKRDSNNDIVVDATSNLDVLISNFRATSKVVGLGKGAEGRTLFSINGEISFWVGGEGEEPPAPTPVIPEPTQLDSLVPLAGCDVDTEINPNTGGIAIKGGNNVLLMTATEGGAPLVEQYSGETYYAQLLNDAAVVQFKEKGAKPTYAYKFNVYSCMEMAEDTYYVVKAHEDLVFDGTSAIKIMVDSLRGYAQFKGFVVEVTAQKQGEGEWEDPSSDPDLTMKLIF